jgi:hypothetical protein
VTPVAGAVALVAWLAGWLLTGRHRPLAAVAPVPGLPTVSVVVPARDEEARLPRLLAGLAAAEPPPAEVIVVDDGSTDATAVLAQRAGATVLAAEPPAGWTGKAWACQRGAEAAVGQVLVFLDADIEPAPDAVGLLASAAAAGDLVSVQPRHRVERWYERLSAGPAAISVLGAGIGPPPRVRWWRRPMAFGPAIAVRRDVYERAGGHAAARTAVAEDLALARAADRAGVAVRSFAGDDRLGYRMYPEGAGSLVEGWSKNLAAGAGATPPVRLAAVVVWVGGALQGPLALVADPSALAVAAYLAFAGQFGLLLRRVGRFGAATALAYPVALLAFLALFARSLLITARGRPVPWRGRRVPVRA